MTTPHPPGDSADRPDLRIGRLELVGLALALSALAGTVFASLDVFFHTTDRHSPGEVPVALALAAMPWIALFTPLALALALTMRLTGASPSRRLWNALLASAAIVALAAADVLLGVTRGWPWIYLLLLAIALFVAVVAYAIVIRWRLLDTAGAGAAYALAALDGVVVATCVVASVRAGASVLLWGALGVVLLAGLALIARRVARSPGRTAALLVACLGVWLGLFVWIWTPSAGPSVAAASASDAPPDVVLIVLDTTRRDRLGPYGESESLTPVLDELAAESAVYEGTFSPSPWTIPSHASMFTGLYPVSHGADYPHHIYLDDEFATLAEMLRDVGYQTAAFTSNYHLTRCNAFQGFETSVFGLGPYDGWRTKGVATRLGFPARWVDQGGFEVLRDLRTWLSETHDPTRPSFVFVNFFEPHAPYLPPRRERLSYLPKEVGYLEATRFALGFDHGRAHITGLVDPYTERLVSGLYDGEIRYQDRRFGEVLSALRTGLDLDNTLLIVTADHGENIGDGGRWEHQFALNDALIHVPLLIRFPELFPAGARIGGLSQLVDLIPTIFDVIGEEVPVSDLPGRTLVPERFVARERVYAQFWPFLMNLRDVEITRGAKAGVGRFLAELRTVHDGRLKLVWASDGHHRLYDVREDPMETFDLSARLPEQSRALQEELAAWWSAQPAYEATETEEEIQPMDPELIERLRSLGYIN